ncbi:MAG: 2-oxoacid:acceptor oxidoreductase subunit alpha [Rhodothermales bacterium]|nr:2-oxoacid:acceptor oxidoreductase subunit alpha [Rhodothermales bacterium]
MSSEKDAREAIDSGLAVAPHVIREHVVEIVSDAGEGAQKAGQSFGTISAKMGNGVWTVEIIPAEIQPPPRNAAGASGIRVRIGAFPITNMGDEVDLIVAFNEQALLGRLDRAQFKPDARILLESKWRNHPDPTIAAEYSEALSRLEDAGYRVLEVPMEEICLKHVTNPERGKNMLALGMLCRVYGRDMETARDTVRFTFRKKAQKVIDSNLTLLDAGYAWAAENLDFSYEVGPMEDTSDKIVVNGNQAIALGVMASGMEVCAMYPITPATSASHYLSDIFENVGGVVHQAEDEIAAAGVAIGASYAGKCSVTITSGPGMSLKTELIGLATMAEIPLVIVNVQRGGPSTGLPTKVEQGDLLQALFGAHGDAPKVVMAPATIQDCFYAIPTARKIAETFRIPVVVLSDANLATGQQPFTRPTFAKEWVAPPIDQRPVPEGSLPYDWDPKTGLSTRFIPGQKGGMHTLTGLAHTRSSKVAYLPLINQEGCEMRSLKIAALQKTLSTPKPHGADSGELLIVGWGSTQGAIHEAVDRCREAGLDVSALHLTFLQPMAPGIGDVLKRFRRVVAVEMNFADEDHHDLITEDNRRYSNLAFLLRARYLVDVQSFAHVHGQPLRPARIVNMIRETLKQEAVPETAS